MKKIGVGGSKSNFSLQDNRVHGGGTVASEHDVRISFREKGADGSRARSVSNGGGRTFRGD